jgi:hypothetical protein
MLHLFSYILYNPIFIICQAWSLPLVACGLLLDAFEKSLTAAQVAGRQRAMVPQKIMR